jgi:hypothetical protein
MTPRETAEWWANRCEEAITAAVEEARAEERVKPCRECGCDAECREKGERGR